MSSKWIRRNVFKNIATTSAVRFPFESSENRVYVENFARLCCYCLHKGLKDNINCIVFGAYDEHECRPICNTNAVIHLLVRGRTG